MLPHVTNPASPRLAIIRPVKALPLIKTPPFCLAHIVIRPEKSAALFPIKREYSNMLEFSPL
jgi:hypothetical protein